MRSSTCNAGEKFDTIINAVNEMQCNAMWKKSDGVIKCQMSTQELRQRPEDRRNIILIIIIILLLRIINTIIIIPLKIVIMMIIIMIIIISPQELRQGLKREERLFPSAVKAILLLRCQEDPGHDHDDHDDHDDDAGHNDYALMGI